MVKLNTRILKSGIIHEPEEPRSIVACSFLINKYKDLGSLVPNDKIPLWGQIMLHEDIADAKEKLGVIFRIIHGKKQKKGKVTLMETIMKILTSGNVSQLYNVVAKIITKSQGDTANELDPERADTERISAGRYISADDLNNILQSRVQGEQESTEGLRALLKGDPEQFIDIVLKSQFHDDEHITNIKLALKLLHPSSDTQEREMYTTLC